ncbi:MAG: FtsQ-type POTRA domain-containing protein [Anaerolineae bacterium]|nr:FtsQ-type POTRA domain-containing protein [Anaerolineae bacterium]MCX8067487.1 FtsQ-type POTRA domain-containing protein [Anaerolineae bacterium]MDW7991750.1 FtsQ-type POTRA domain-containing protein [Anaerolineae bacterium]
MPAARRGSRKRRRNFRQSVPLVIGGRVAERPAGARPTTVLGAMGGIALLGLILWFAFSPQFYVTNAEVVGAQRVPAEAIFAASGLQNLHILWANPRAAAQRILETVPSIERVEVSCRLPARCAIAVKEREVMAVWEQEGTYSWVDPAGGAFPGTGPVAGKWLVSGPLPLNEQGRVDPDVLVGLEELERLGFRPGRVSYRPGRGLVLEDPAGWRVIVGEGTGMERRIWVYLKIRAHLLERGIHPRFVDVRFPEAPYYSVTNEW